MYVRTAYYLGIYDRTILHMYINSILNCILNMYGKESLTKGKKRERFSFVIADIGKGEKWETF